MHNQLPQFGFPGVRYLTRFLDSYALYRCIQLSLSVVLGCFVIRNSFLCKGHAFIWGIRYEEDNNNIFLCKFLFAMYNSKFRYEM